MNTYEDKFWRIASPRFPDGCDPYNSVDTIRAAEKALIAEMEQCWQKCIKRDTPLPEFIMVSPGFYDALQKIEEHVKWMATIPAAQRGHEFLPYG